MRAGTAAALLCANGTVEGNPRIAAFGTLAPRSFGEARSAACAVKKKRRDRYGAQGFHAHLKETGGLRAWC